MSWLVSDKELTWKFFVSCGFFKKFCVNSSLLIVQLNRLWQLTITESQRVLATSPLALSPAMYAAAPAVPAGAQLFLAPRLPSPFGSVASLSATAGTPTLLSAGATSLIPTHDSAAVSAAGVIYPYGQYLPPMLEYSTAGLDRSAAGKHVLFACHTETHTFNKNWLSL